MAKILALHHKHLKLLKPFCVFCQKMFLINWFAERKSRKRDCTV